VPDTPTVILAADHRARGVITIEPYAEYLAALHAAMPWCDGVLATAQPLADLVADGAAGPGSGKTTYLSINRTGLAGSAFELDDRLVASVAAAVHSGYTGIKHMTRIDKSERETARALELLGEVLESAREAGVEALIEPLSWKDGGVDRSTDGIVYAAVIAHDMGAPLIKVPVPNDAEPGRPRVDAVRRVVDSVGVPVLFLGGPRQASREGILSELADAMSGGGAGVAIGRAVYQDPSPGVMAGLVADVVRGVRSLEEAVAAAGR
jgi:DhnA family fructose-bisphosphate aldolase class Ia